MNSANYTTELTANLSINTSSSSVFTVTLCCMSNTSPSDRAPMPSLCDDSVTRHNTRVTTMGRSTAAGKFDIQIYFSGELQLYVECSHSLFMSIHCKSRRCQLSLVISFTKSEGYVGTLITLIPPCRVSVLCRPPVSVSSMSPSSSCHWANGHNSDLHYPLLCDH